MRRIKQTFWYMCGTVTWQLNRPFTALHVWCMNNWLDTFKEDQRG